jgi:hypothetical protein
MVCFLKKLDKELVGENWLKVFLYPGEKLYLQIKRIS